MNRRLSWLLVVGFLLLVSLYLQQRALQSIHHTRVKQAPGAEARKEEPKPEIKAATPEDPGPIATVVSPLNGLTNEGKPVAGVASAPQPADHVTVSSALPPENVLHGAFPLKGYVKFEFLVPGYAKNPRLHGRFHSRLRSQGADQKVRQPATVELLLLTEEEFAVFLHGQHGTSSNTAGPASNLAIDWALAATSRQPRRYYLLFRNPEEDGPARWVDADFTIAFE